MKATVDELERRAQILQPGFEQYVIERHGNKAKVKSFTSDAVYDVSIMLGTEEGERRVICTCPATKLCRHIVAFYAVAKGITSMRTDKDVKEEAGKSTVGHDEGTEPLPEATADGRKMIAAAIEMLVNGIALVVTERMKEE